ncbi:MAG: hypothetical protein R6V40_01365, partial [Candidatus Moraniibacteriota bacterium]
MNIFNVEIEDSSRKDIWKKVQVGFEGNKKLSIATLNPEMLLFAKKNKEYKKILSNFDLKLADGFGVVLVSRIKFFKKISRYPGADLA